MEKSIGTYPISISDATSTVCVWLTAVKRKGMSERRANLQLSRDSCKSSFEKMLVLTP